MSKVYQLLQVCRDSYMTSLKSRVKSLAQFLMYHHKWAQKLGRETATYFTLVRFGAGAS